MQVQVGESMVEAKNLKDAPGLIIYKALRGKGYSVSHAESTLQIAWFPLQRDALKAASFLNGLADWTKTVDELRAAADMSKISNKIKEYCTNNSFC